MSEVPLPSPAFTSWPTFPFEGDLRVKKLDDPVEVEPPRHGEDPADCSACRASDDSYIWVSERWRVRSLEQPTGLPMVLILESRSHLDLGDLPNLLAAELGVLTVRLERAMRSLDGVARVHVNRWGDGSAHLHVWFLARPYGRLQLRGTFLSLWDDILPRIPEDQWRANLALVAEWLAEFGGRSLAEPPRIDWQAPALFARAPEPEAEADTEAEDGAEDEDAPESVALDDAASNGAKRETGSADTSEPDNDEAARSVPATADGAGSAGRRTPSTSAVVADDAADDLVGLVKADAASNPAAGGSAIGAGAAAGSGVGAAAGAAAGSGVGAAAGATAGSGGGAGATAGTASAKSRHGTVGAPAARRPGGDVIPSGVGADQ